MWQKNSIMYFQNTTTKTKIKSKLEIYKTNKTGKKIKYKNKDSKYE